MNKKYKEILITTTQIAIVTIVIFTLMLFAFKRELNSEYTRGKAPENISYENNEFSIISSKY